MKVLLINIDSTIDNLALKKIEKYHKDRGDEVTWDFPLMKFSADKVYVSCIFDFNKEQCREYEGLPNAVIGGSGYDMKINLPPEIEAIKPHINLGFTTRGCIRRCYFCIVPQKEGNIRAENDIYDIWDGKSKKITLLDNNVLALPEHFLKIAAQLKKENLSVDFNQGLDHRLLTDEIAKEIMSIKFFREIRFAFDDEKYFPTVTRAMELLKKYGLKDWGTRWYVYVGEKDDFYSVYKRVKYLWENKQLVYLMRDVKTHNIPEYEFLSTWTAFVGDYKNNIKDVLELEKHKRFKECMSKYEL